MDGYVWGRYLLTECALDLWHVDPAMVGGSADEFGGLLRNVESNVLTRALRVDPKEPFLAE